MSFKDFARTEIYAFHRLTATLLTFLIGASFVVITLKEGDIGCADKYLFAAVIVLGFASILIIWWRIKRTLYKYYNELEEPSFEETDIY